MIERQGGRTQGSGRVTGYQATDIERAIADTVLTDRLTS